VANVYAPNSTALTAPEKRSRCRKPGNAVAVPGVPVSAGARRKGFKAELDGLRERMLGLGFSNDEIAAEVSRRYRVRPREAYRLACGWSLERAAARFNDRAWREGADPQARAGMSGSHLCEYEKWPGSTRKPSVYVLCLLAEIYETGVLCLLDLADHESLPQQDRLVLMRRPRAETPFGERAVALMQARGLSLRQTASRISCSAGYLSNVIHGRKRPSMRVAARLDDLLEAGSELITLARTAEVVIPGDEPEPRGVLGSQAGEARAVIGGCMSLTLPYVPGRLVIEVSGLAENAGQLAGDGEDREAAGGRLTLVRRVASPGTKTEVTG
jgi:transcriptional regulator with XRE-family HTH domain